MKVEFFNHDVLHRNNRNSIYMSVLPRLEWLERAFLAPFYSKGRIFNYMAGFLGTFGFAGTMAYFSYDFAQLGAAPLLLYFFVRLGLAGFVFMPLVFFILYKLSLRKAYALMLSAQILTIAYLFLNPEMITAYDLFSVSLVGVFFSVMSAPFWAGFHLGMICHTTDENMGNEVSISSIILFSGGMSGGIFSGIALAYFPGVFVGLLLFSAMFVATLFQMILMWYTDTSPVKATPFKPFKLIPKQKMMLWATAQEGVFQFLTSFSAPVWMWFIGIKSVAMGFLISLQGAMKFLVSPLAGHFFHERKTRDMLFGGFLKPLGWLPWIIFQAPWVMFLSSFLWTAGNHLFSTGLASRWYSQRCLASQALREMGLATGRIICAFITIPLLFGLGAKAFFIAAFMLTALTGVMAIFMKKHEQRSN